MTSKEGSHPRATFLVAHRLSADGQREVSVARRAGRARDRRPDQRPAVLRARSAGADRTAAAAGFWASSSIRFDIQNPTAPPTNTRPTTETARYQRRLDLLDRLQADFARQAPQEVADHQKLYDQRREDDPQPRDEGLRSEPGAGVDRARRTAATQFGQGCLLARRLVETGVTFVEVTSNGWDTHDDNFARVENACRAGRSALRALIRDLKDRGMLDSTLVVWMGEFGRTPNINPRGGRDHYPRALQRRPGRRRRARRPGDRRDRRRTARPSRTGRSRCRTSSKRSATALKIDAQQGKHERRRPADQDRRRRRGGEGAAGVTTK